MLDTAFPRYLGDIGNPDSFAFPVRYGIVPGATPDAIVRGPVAPWTAAFIARGSALVAEGCTALTTTCGFLTLVRGAVEDACGVPVVSSALELVPDLIAAGERPGILTISEASLTSAHLSAAGVPTGTPITGVDGGHFADAILTNAPRLDPARSEAELVAGARQLCAAHPALTAIVLECTNMPPHARAIADASGLRVVSILTAVDRLQRRVGQRGNRITVSDVG